MSRQRIRRRSEVRLPYRDDVDRRLDLARSLDEPVNGRPPLVLTREVANATGQPGDTKIRVLNLWCAPCQAFVGDVTSYEVGERLPGHRPYLVLRTQLPDPSRAPVEDGLPQLRVAEALLDDAGDPWLREQMDFHAADPPDEFTTHCRVHALLAQTPSTGHPQRIRLRDLRRTTRPQRPEASP